MIDKKKITEAAKLYAWDNRSDEGGEEDTLDKMRAFKTGIKWFLNNLWHDASEEPEMYRLLLVQFQDGSIILLTYSVKGTWGYIVNRIPKRRWLYIDDLLKGGFK